MPGKRIYTLALSYGLYEVVVFSSWAPLVLFAGCGMVHMAIKDS